MTDEKRLQVITEQLLIVRDNLLRGMSKSIQKLQAKSINETLELPNFTKSPQRPWVGLTSEEIYACDEECNIPQYDITNADLQSFAKAIEAKLKEKNTP